MISAVVSTCGAPFAVDYIRTLPAFSEVVIVLDLQGRQSAKFHATYPLERFVQDIDSISHLRHKRLVIHDPGPGKWSAMNGCYNAGAKVTTNPWLLFTHDDVLWPTDGTGEELRQRVETALDWCDATEMHERHVLAGVVLHEEEIANRVVVPTPLPDPTRPALTQFFSPVVSFMARWAYAAIGGFDEQHGVWYDGQVEEEAKRRGWWFVCPPIATLPRHESNKTFNANNWGNRWALNPIWGRYQENFKRMYGHEPVRRAADIWAPVGVPALW